MYASLDENDNLAEEEEKGRGFGNYANAKIPPPLDIDDFVPPDRRLAVAQSEGI